MRKELQESLQTSPYAERLTVVTTGSYGRREASDLSDLDYYLFFDADLPGDEAIPDEQSLIAEIVNKHVPGSVGDTGTFGHDAIADFKEMITNIGGLQDTNQLMTRRMLFLLEGDWLYNESRFNDYRRRLLGKYLREDARPDAIPLFLLNDIIRYYRTITTDLEHKVTTQGKSWGLRNIKLRFSRKMLYFGGIIVAAELVGQNHQPRIDEAGRLFSMPVIERIQHLSDADQAREILQIYDGFLADMASEAVRRELEGVQRENRWQSGHYNRLRESGHDFSRALNTWLKGHYAEAHPIHQALIF